MSKATQRKKSRPKAKPRRRPRRGPPMPSLADLPNPGVVAALTQAATESMANLPDKPGMDTLRELAPGSLLMMAARQAQELGVPMTMQIEDGEPFVVRPVDIEAAGFGMMARAMSKVAAKLFDPKSKAPMRLFEGPQIKKTEPKE